MAPTEFCAKARTGMDDPIFENQFTLRSVATGTSDGRVLDTNVKTIGSVHSCDGRTANPAIFLFYGTSSLSALPLKALANAIRRNLISLNEA